MAHFGGTMKKIYYGWWIILACALINLYVGGIVFFGFTAFFAPIRDEFGWSYAQISFAVSLRGMEVGIFSPIGTGSCSWPWLPVCWRVLAAVS